MITGGRHRHRHRRRHRRRHRLQYRLRMGAGGVLLLLAVAGVGYPLAWQDHQRTAGQRLVVRDRAHAETVGGDSPTCPARPGPGVLVIPALGLTAPVSQGLTDAVLAVSLGHDPSTPWPGAGSGSLVAGHDVGFLSGDTALRPGDTLSYEEPCAILHFVVDRHVISGPGQHVAVPAEGGLVLDSCWPTDALWYTPDRYLVITRYVSTTRAPALLPPVTSPPPVPTVALPSGLSAADVSLASNPWPMGTLHSTGTPSPQWGQSQAALRVGTDALDLLFGLRRAITDHAPSWSGSLAPGLPVPAWLAGEPARPIDITEQVDGSTVTGVTLTSGVRSSRSTVLFEITATVSRSVMVVTAIRRLP